MSADKKNAKKLVPVEAPSRVVEVDSAYGKGLVKIEGELKGRNTPVLLTIHDVGLNAETCFTRFMNFTRANESLLNDLVAVHVTLPGQHFDAEDLPKEVGVMEMGELLAFVERVVEQLEIGYFVGMGVGLGAFLLELLAAKHPDAAVALVLMGATTRKLGWYEWRDHMWAAWASENAYKSNLLNRWFSWHIDQRAPILYEYKDLIDHMNRRNLDLLLKGFHQRKDIAEELKKVTCPMLLVTGDRTPYVHDVFEITSRGGVDKKLITVIHPDGTGILVTEHRPDVLLQPIDLMLNGLGFFRNLGGIKTFA
jgi:pimeloyl-ACP methyl ester carboxylesterase